MVRERKCILCETLQASKQEMDEHMRSMLHHRELEKLKGRDCGHDCRVCKVTVVSLTDYASHISSATHKQNVEAAEQQPSGNDVDDYFDQALVDLIEKRKDKIRKEKLAAEEAERRKKEERYRRSTSWKQTPQGSTGHNSWYRSNERDARLEQAQPWHHGRQGRSATWHAQEPPNLDRWGPADAWNRMQRDHGAFSGNPQTRHPWLSNRGSSNGLYGQNNISQYPQRSRPLSFLGPPVNPPVPKHFNQAMNLFENTHNGPGGRQDHRVKNGDGHTAESDHSGAKGSKSFGSNPKLDKACRFSPYPVTKSVESIPDSFNKCPKGPKPQTPESSASNGPSQLEQKPGQSVEDKIKEDRKEDKIKPKTKPKDGSGSGAQRDGPSSETPVKPVSPSVPCLNSGDDLSKASSQTHAQAKPTRKHSGPPGSKAPPGPLQSKQGRQLLESSTKARQMESERTGPLDNAIRHGRAKAERSLDGLAPSQAENSCRQVGSVRQEKAALPSSDSSQFLQSVQVTTSTVEGSEPTSVNGEDEEPGKMVEEETNSLSPDEAMQAVEAGPSLESDASTSGDAQALSGSLALSKLDLPPVLKRKSKAGSHEPNLNIARRVRNVSESRRSETEKESGLKPTVRQLINFSGSRRNVNWEQVYQEVRKKQDKGRGMPRFGIEMVPYDQEEHSPEEEDIPLVEGFQWESILVPNGIRKRSLSESSLAPAAIQSLFTPREDLSSDPRGTRQSGNCQRDVEVDELETKAEKQPDKLTSAAVKALQGSESVLGDSSSGTEQHDGQGPGKRRRAAGDVPSTETSCLEHNSKRRKVKSKKERSQIDQLLTVSLREDELSRSLQTVDASLIQARAALEAAYVEVQRLVVVKQQMTAEMSTLRNKRIELLKGMQGHLEEAPQIPLKEEKGDPFDAAPHVPSPSSTCGSPPSSTLSFTPAEIKEEPRSPQPVDSMTLLDLPHAAATSPPDPAENFQHIPEEKIKSEPHQSDTERHWEKILESGDSKESEPGDTTEKATNTCVVSDSKSPLKSLLPSRRGSEAGATLSCEPPPLPSVFNIPASPSELRSGKRVRKLKKRKVLRKAQGTDQPDTSDTEIDGEATRPRWQRPRRRPSGGSQVSTSSEEAANVPLPTVTLKRVILSPCEHIPQVASPEPAVTLDAGEAMEVTAAFQQPLGGRASAPAHSPQTLACNEVTSTSDMDVCKSSESEMPFPISLPKTAKISSDASSDHGEEEMPTEGVFEGHQEAVNAMQIHGGLLYTCSGDRTVRAFDLVTRKCVAVFEGHSSKVSCLLVSTAPSLRRRLYSGSSDQTICCYSLKTQELEQQFSLPDRVLCLHSRWKTLYAGLANGTVVTFNLRTNKQTGVLECHGPRAVSCLASSQEGSRRLLLVGSYDSTITVRDAKNGLLLRTLEGHTKTVLCMKVVNDLVFSGSSDQRVYAHSIHTGELVRAYKGHSHAVSVVTVLGKVMVTACLDKLVRVYDLQSRGQLQVYGGHGDMVMCMAVHKNMIYTGCYDGSVRAVRLNLLQKHRCWWHGCSMVFGVVEHLQQHLVHDHTSPSLQTTKCRWGNCEEFFSARNSSKQGMLLHMRKHAEEETGVEP